MKNKIATALILALIAANLSACAQKGAEAPAETVQKTDEAAGEEQEAKALAEAPAEETPEIGKAPAEAAARPVYSTLEYNFMEELDDIMIARGSYEIVKLTEESAIAYPQLNKMIEEENEEIAKRFKGGFEEIREAAKSYCEDNDVNPEELPETVSEAKITPVRCDSSAVSYYETGYTNYPGAAHGFIGYRSYNFDTATGSEIELTDVFTDIQMLRAAVYENLTAVGDGSQVTGESTEGLLTSAFDEGYDDLDWVLDQEGVTFIFAPYEIAPYALGTIEAKISFAAYPDLFTGKYATAAEGYVKKLDPNTAAKVDVDGDGTEEMISVSGVSEENSDYPLYFGLKVEIGDQSCTTEDYFYSYAPYFVRTDDGNSFIYVITTTDNDYQNLTVFAIKDKVPSAVGTMWRTGVASSYHEVDDEEGTDADSYIENMITIDPSRFALTTRMNLMSTYGAYRFYKVGRSGMPEPLTDYYVINTERVLTSLVPLTVEKVDVPTGEATGEETEIPAWTKCSLWHTNGEDTVDLMLEDGSAIRVKVTGDGWPQMVNGVELDEAFDGTMFAG